MSEADMKSDIRRLMNRTKRRAVPADVHVIRRSGYVESKTHKPVIAPMNIIVPKANATAMQRLETRAKAMKPLGR